jgi:hypothetical protein
MEPATAFPKTTVKEIEVMVAGLAVGYTRSRTGTSRKPPPAPTMAPYAPTAKPRGTSSQSVGTYSSDG